jgi:hypothetical protein
MGGGKIDMMRGGPRKKKPKIPKYPCRSLTETEIAACNYTEPLTAMEIMAKASIPEPDRSHTKAKKNHKAKAKNK